MTDLQTWIHDNDDKFYGVRKYKKVYTPYEQQKAYSDETQYEWDKTCKIIEAIEIPNDVLLGLQEYSELEEISDDNTIMWKVEKIGGLLYVRLSDIIIEDITDAIVKTD